MKKVHHMTLKKYKSEELRKIEEIESYKDFAFGWKPSTHDIVLEHNKCVMIEKETNTTIDLDDETLYTSIEDDYERLKLRKTMDFCCCINIMYESLKRHRERMQRKGMFSQEELEERGLIKKQEDNQMITFGKIATQQIEEIVSIIEEVKNTSSTNGKQEILKRNKNNDGLQAILDLTYNPHRKYKITEKTLTGDFKKEDTYNNLMDLLHILNGSNINDELRNKTRNFLDQTDENIRDLYRGVLLKDLRLGCNVSTINKIWKGLIPLSETGVDIKPMLASKFDLEKPPTGKYVVTEKLDGIRCVAICTDSKVELYSRQGKLIEGCREIEESLALIREYMETDIVLDGELLADNCDYATVYKETTKRVKNKNEVKIGIHYTIFDILDIEEFTDKKCTMPYYERMEVLLDIFKHFGMGHRLPKLEMIKELYAGSDINKLMELLEEYRNKGAEGLMVNLIDGLYEFKRSKNILKVKVMQTVDLKIIGFEEGQGKNKGKLGALLVDYRGNTVGVGSGFSDYEREYIWNNQDMFLGKICEIQFFEESKNKDGGISLRFPVWKHLRPDKDKPSYY